VQILDLAEVDLQEGFDFYERQESGVGVSLTRFTTRWTA
jgi:hypothetical protein